VLVVDDDAAARAALEKLLRADGFETSTAPDGEAALAAVGRTMPDVVLTDLEMPLLDGVELCRRLHELNSELPVILTTAHSDMEPVIASLRAGAEDYLLKPLDGDAVLWCVERAIARRDEKVERDGLHRALNEHLVLSNLREQEHAEAEALHRAQLTALLANLSEGVVVAEPSGRILMVNDAARGILGLEDEHPTIDAIHSHETNDLGGRHLGIEERPLSRALRGEQFVDHEVDWVRSSGERRRLVSTGTSVRDVDGNVAMAVVVFRDVTEVRRLERLREESLALVTHDLRNPLSTILMSLSLLKGATAEDRGARLPADASVKTAERAERNVKRMTAMLDELSESARLESQGIPLRRVACDLRTLVANALDTLDDARARRITIEAGDTSPYVVLADASRLERVVVNLLTNALKYSADDAPVTMRLGRRGKDVGLEIVDRGIGIPSESLNLLFQRYYRTSAGKAHASGLGLGLYIARLVVEAHGGRIEVSSKVGQGSTFTVSLPSST
jgi:PAS domain S-box-containing protein